MATENRLHERLLVLRYQAGDEKAFAELVRRYHGGLTYFVRRLAKNPAAADDIVQDGWLKAFRRLRTLRDPDAFRVWLYRIARRRAFNALRDAKHFQPLREDLAASDREGPEEKAFRAEEAPLVHRCMEALRPEHREVLLLRFLEEMSYESIAEVVGCNVGTVRSRLHYAKAALRREMERDHGWTAGFVRRF